MSKLIGLLLHLKLLGSVAQSIVNLPGVSLTSRFAKLGVKYLEHPVLELAQSKFTTGFTNLQVFNPKLKAFKLEFKSFLGTFNSVVWR